jgi:hypothetical protein
MNDVISQPSESFYKELEYQKPVSPKFKHGSLPRSITKEGVPIINRSSRRSFAASYSMSPDTKQPSSIKSSPTNFIPFTPPIGEKTSLLTGKLSNELFGVPSTFSTAVVKKNDLQAYLLNEYRDVAPPFESKKV